MDERSGADIYVLKDGERFGPFSVDELLDLLDNGEIEYDDLCHFEGTEDDELLVCEALDWEDGEAPVGGEEESETAGEESAAAAAPIPKPKPKPAPPKKSRRKSGAPPKNPRLILYAGHPSVLSFPFTVAFIVASLATGWWFRHLSGWWLFAGLLGALFGVSWILLQRSLNLYVITPKRVEVVTGFIAKSSNEVRIEDIRAINVLTPGLAGLLGVGTVEFASAGGDAVDVAFTNVYAAHRVKGLVRRLQDALGEEA